MVMVACGNKAMMHAEFLNWGGAPNEKIFLKSMEVLDTSGENQVYLTLKSNDAKLLEAYTPDVFTLTALFERSPPNLLEEEAGRGDPFEKNKEPEPDGAPFVEYEVKGSKLVPEAMGFRLKEHLPAGHRPFFMWRYSYSYDDSFEIRRDSFRSRVYFKAWYQARADSDWLPWLAERDLKQSETFRASMPASHQLKVGIKARRAEHYELEFFER
jgi:hypothetical protein